MGSSEVRCRCYCQQGHAEESWKTGKDCEECVGWVTEWEAVKIIK